MSLLARRKGKLKSIILTWASLIAQEFNSISSAPIRVWDLMEATRGTLEQASSVSNEEGKPVWTVCRGRTQTSLPGEVENVPERTTRTGQFLQGWGCPRPSGRCSGNRSGDVLLHQSQVHC